MSHQPDLMTQQYLRKRDHRQFKGLDAICPEELSLPKDLLIQNTRIFQYSP